MPAHYWNRPAAERRRIEREARINERQIAKRARLEREARSMARVRAAAAARLATDARRDALRQATACTVCGGRARGYVPVGRLPNGGADLQVVSCPACGGV